jgi:hydroxyacylglutathione hydrolase
MPLEIITVPCLSDNYAYIIRDTETDQVAVVDVPDAKPILKVLNEKGWSLDHILITHHHDDHIMGVEELRAATGASVAGGAPDAYRLPPLDTLLADGDTFQLGNESCRVIDVSGHTLGHIAFIFDQALAAFTADSLMAWGCGRVIEGTMEMQWHTLHKFHTLPRAMMIYSGHEYTAGNSKFALTIEPDNESYIARAAEVEAARAKGHPTVPSNLGLELATNPFLRANHPKLKAAIGMENASDADVFAAVRTRKDKF